jgi:hypothetical protein
MSAASFIGMAGTMGHGKNGASDFKPEEKRVIFASSLGTVFESYGFYLLCDVLALLSMRCRWV